MNEEIKKHFAEEDAYSYFDPFGNLPLTKRIRLELAREYRKSSKEKEFAKEIALVLDGLSDYKKQILNLYIDKYLL